MSEVSDFYLIFDRSDPKQPLLVVARACVSCPADAVLDAPDGHATSTGSTSWLSRVGIATFAWLSRVFGRSTALRITKPGEECYATRISHNTPDTWAGGDYETGWADDGTRFHYWDDAWDAGLDDDRA